MVLCSRLSQSPASLYTALQWVIIDSKVFDLSRFAAMHPGGLSVLLDEEVGAFVLATFSNISGS